MDTDILFQIQPGSAEPIYRQLIEQLRRRVAAGQWVAGQELPSVRELALQLAVNPMTVSKAYSLMEAEGLLERRRGLPMVIAAQRAKAAPRAERLQQLRPVLAQAAAVAQELGVPTPEALRLFETLLKQSGDPR